MEHAFLYRSGMWIAEKEENPRATPIFPRYETLALKGNGMTARIQLVNCTLVRISAFTIPLAQMVRRAAIPLSQSRGVNCIDLGFPLHVAPTKCA